MHTYALLTLTIFLEAAATMALKLSQDIPMCFVLAYALYGAAFALFPRVLDDISIGIAYAVWSGAGCTLTAVGGDFIFGETLLPRQMAAMGLVLLGVSGMLL